MLQELVPGCNKVINGRPASEICIPMILSGWSLVLMIFLLRLLGRQ